MDENLSLTKEEKFYYVFNKIEDFFKSKEEHITKYKNISIEESLKNAPKYFAFISLVEKLNILLHKDQKWLEHFVEKKNINFDFQLYQQWKANRKYDDATVHYDNTQCPSKWIYSIQDLFIDILETLQVLLVLEHYISDDEYKKFLKDNPKIFFKLKVNYTKSSPPSEKIEMLFQVVDFLLDINNEHNFLVNPVINSTLCMKAYRKIDELKIFELLKQKEFFINYRIIFLVKTNNATRKKLPYESDVIEIGEKFLKTYADLVVTYNEYKKRLIQKYNNSKR